MCGVVITESGLKLRRVRNGRVKGEKKNSVAKP